MNPTINRDLCHMSFSPAPLVLPSFNNVLPAMILQRKVMRSNSRCVSCTSSHSGVCRVPSILHLNLPSGLRRRVVVVVLVLLLLLSGDIETNPGPVGAFLFPCSKTFHHTDIMSHSQPVGQQLTVDDDLRVVMEELNNVSSKWYDVGMYLGVSVGRLDVIKKQYSDLSDCFRETIKTWLQTCVPPPTWINIVEMLRTRTVNETRLAVELECKYCSSRRDSPPPIPTQLTVPHPPDALQSETTPQHPLQPAVAAGM